MVGKGTITMRETRILEFKETITNTFLKTVSAFSNYNGGTILFGVDDNGNVKGLPDVKQACLDIENKINDSISPQPNYTLEIQNNDQPDYTLEAQKDHTIILSVKSGAYKPYLYKSKAYKRNDTATIEVDTLEFSRLVLDGKNISFEELPCKDQELSFKILQISENAENWPFVVSMLLPASSATAKCVKIPSVIRFSKLQTLRNSFIVSKFSLSFLKTKPIRLIPVSILR